MAGSPPAGRPPEDFGAPALLARIHGSLREGAGNGAREMTFGAFGTGCRIAFVATPPVAAAFQTAVLAWVAAFEAKWSRFWDASLVSRINAAAGKEPVALDPDGDRIFALCHELHFLTRGVFDPTALPLLKLWDWRRQRTALPTDAEIAEAKALVGWRGVQRVPGKIFLPRAGMGIDLGGMGKEYAVDQVAMLARAHGCTSALVDFGADIRAFGPPPDGRAAWHIGLEDPRKPGACWTGLAVLDAAVATSGDYVRKFDAGGTRYGHILDIRTGRPVSNGVLSVSVLAPSCTQAGMLTTSIFALGAEEGRKLLDTTMGAEGAIVTETQTLVSRRFHAYATA